MTFVNLDCIKLQNFSKPGFYPVPLKVQTIFKVRTDRFPAGIMYKRKHQDSLNKQLKALGDFSIRDLSLKRQTITKIPAAPTIKPLRGGLWGASQEHSTGTSPSTALLEPKGMPGVRGGDPGSQTFHYSSVQVNRFLCAKSQRLRRHSLRFSF